MILLFLSLAAQTAPISDEAWRERNRPDMPHLPACALPAAAAVPTLRDLPEPIRGVLTQLFASAGGLSDAGGPYNSTDMVDGAGVPQQRFLRAYQVADRWVVWYERGGWVRNFNTVLIGKVRAGEYTVLPNAILVGDPCAASRALLDGVRSR